MSVDELGYNSSVILDTGPQEVLMDDVIPIRVLGLTPREQVTIHAVLKENGRTFGSAACFNADGVGVVDACEHPAIRGTYTGVHPMGLFWSMVPAPGEPPGLRLFKRDASKPLVTNISVYKGHLNSEDLFSSNHKPFCNKMINRWYMDREVRKVTVRQGRIRGAVFIPKGAGPFPAIIDMFGVAGSLAEFRAALLASRGFVAYALPYFAYDDLPMTLTNMDFEYFMEATNWLASQSYVSGDGIGVLGVSKGGEIALHLAYYSSQVKAVVSVNGAAFFSRQPMTYHGSHIGISGSDETKIRITNEGTVYRDIYVCDPEDYLPLYRRDVSVLLIVGEDDMTLNPRYLKAFYDTYPVDRRHLVEMCTYPGAGHLIEPPYSPMTRSTMRIKRGAKPHEATEMVMWGGNTVDHARAQEQSWSKILEFFRTKLTRNSADSRL